MTLDESRTLQIGDFVVAKQPNNDQDYIWFIAPDNQRDREVLQSDGQFLLQAAPGMEEGGQLDEIHIHCLNFERYVA